jgi:hypothetical protein
MNEVKFCEYKVTPGEKHLGIATILVNNIIYIRYKMMAGKNGGTYPNSPSYKVSENGVDTYIPAIVIESNMLNEQIKECIKSNMSRYTQSSSPENPYRSDPALASLGDCPF